MQHYQRIRDLREDNDLTQEALCKKLYMHKTTYTNYEQESIPFRWILPYFWQISTMSASTTSPDARTP